MDIITFSEELQKRITEIDASASAQDDMIIRTGKALSDARELMSELKHFTSTYKFQDRQEEIRFFKEIKPVFLSRYLYYRRVFAIVLFDSFRDRKSRIENYYRILTKLQRYAMKHLAFYEYSIAGSTYLDSHYYLRSSRKLSRPERDEHFTTGYDNKLAKILAHELVKQYILDALRKLHEDKPGMENSALPWTDSKVALVELVYAIHAKGAFNNGKANIKQVVHCFEQMFSVDLSNYARIFSEIKNRKSGQVMFLDQLRDSLSKVINDLS